MAELTPEKKAKLEALAPDKVAALLKQGRYSGLNEAKMAYLVRLDEKYKQVEKDTVTSVARANVVAVDRAAKAAEESNRIAKAAGKNREQAQTLAVDALAKATVDTGGWTPFKITMVVIGIMAIVVPAIITIYIWAAS